MRRWFSLIAGLCLLTLLAAPSGAAAATKKPKRCTTKHATLTQDANVRVYRKGDPAYDSTAVYACFRRTGRVTLLGDEFSSSSTSQSVTAAAIAGRFVLFGVWDGDREGSSAEVRVVDVKTGKPSEQRWSASDAKCGGVVRRIVAARDGAGAFTIDGGCEASIARFRQVWRMPRTGPAQLVADNGVIDPNVLSLAGRGFSWSTGGAPIDVAPGSHRPCSPAGAESMAESTQVRVYRTITDRGGSELVACRVGGESRFRMGIAEAGTTVTPLVVRDRHLAWVEARDGERWTRGVSVVTFGEFIYRPRPDVWTRSVGAPSSPCAPEIRNAAIADDGTATFEAYYPCTGTTENGRVRAYS
jgi:hypothetical protein